MRRKSQEKSWLLFIMKAIIDVGSQSLRLLKFSSMEDLLRGDIKLEICPLARDLVDNRLNDNRKKEALKIIQGFISSLDTNEVYLYATSALREALDGQHFIEEIIESFGIKAEIISGDEEARLGEMGVRILAGQGQLSFLDLGGGSTELLLEGSRLSFPMGVVRYNDQVRLEDYFSGLGKVQGNLYGIGGSLSVFTSLIQGINYYDRKLINGKTISRKEINSLTIKMAALDLEERRLFLGEFSKRAETIIAAGKILDYILVRLGKELIYCDYTGLEAYAIDRKLV